MRVVLQRVSYARVLTDGVTAGEIGEGICALVGVAPGDGDGDAQYLADKMINLRIFSDEAGKMNRSLLDTGGAVLAISQFTLYADCRHGRRPSFTDAAPPDLGRRMYDAFTQKLRNAGVSVATGVFGADMKVELSNEGPVTIILDS